MTTNVISNFDVKNKHISILFIIAILFLWILIGFNSGSSDFSYYQMMFERIESGIDYHAVEEGFYVLCKLAVRIGIEYTTFLKIYSAIGLALMSSSILRYTKKPVMVLLFYFFYPFLLDVAQIRHFMACAIFIYAIRYLEKFSVKNIIKYCILIFLAASQQLIALAFFLFLLVYMTDDRKTIKIVVTLMIVMFVFHNMITKLPVFTNILSLRNAEKDYSDGISTTQFLKYLIFYSVLLLASYNLYRLNGKKVNFIFKICMYSAAFIPFILIDFQYTRLFRGCLIIIYIYITNEISIFKKGRNPKKYFWIDEIIVLVMLIVWVTLFGPRSGYYESLTKPILENNAFFSFMHSF